MVTAPQRHSWPIPSIIPYWHIPYSPALKLTEYQGIILLCLVCLRLYLRTFMISPPALLSRSWPLDGDQNSCILKVIPAVIFVGPNNLQPKATNAPLLVVCVFMCHFTCAFQLPISDCIVHCAGPFWSPKLSRSVSAYMHCELFCGFNMFQLESPTPYGCLTYKSF